MALTLDRSASPDPWLNRYYAVRALFSAVWVVLALAVGRHQPAFAAGLIVAYPVWDCLANYVDAKRNGGLRANPTQMLNAVVSAIVAIAVIAALARDFHAVIAVIGVWATLSGILQLSTGVRRWRRAVAQWPMILSGAQSAAAGLHFVTQAADASAIPGIADVAPYAAFGAVYFAISAIVLAVRRR